MSNKNEKNSNEKVREAMSLLSQASKDKKVELSEQMSNIYQRAQEAKDNAVKKAKKKASEIDDTVHKNPWPFIGGAAISGFFLGLILRFRRKE